jgi:RimJ/RimL family protein N-acetyltransferase
MDYSKYFWQGEKVRLRPLKIEDAEQSFIDSLDTPSRQLLQLGTELPTSIDMQKEILCKYADCKEVDGIIIFAIENLEGVHVGNISLHGRHPKNGTFSMGLGISSPYRRQGYAEEAARILMRYCFFERHFQKCNSACVHTNEASIGFHKKLGFIEEGCRRRNFFFNGQYHDEILFGLTKEEFEEKSKD